MGRRRRVCNATITEHNERTNGLCVCVWLCWVMWRRRRDPRLLLFPLSVRRREKEGRTCIVSQTHTHIRSSHTHIHTHQSDSLPMQEIERVRTMYERTRHIVMSYHRFRPPFKGCCMHSHQYDVCVCNIPFTARARALLPFSLPLPLSLSFRKASLFRRRSLLLFSLPPHPACLLA